MPAPGPRGVVSETAVSFASSGRICGPAGGICPCGGGIPAAGSGLGGAPAAGIGFAGAPGAEGWTSELVKSEPSFGFESICSTLIVCVTSAAQRR